MVKVTGDWDIRADKPLLRYLSFLFKPIFSANHRWAMARGEESLRLELGRRRRSEHQPGPIQNYSRICLGLLSRRGR
jgi:hypothetical protein